MMNNYKQIIENKLIEYFDEGINNGQAKYFKDVIKSMKYTTCLGGKRLRGVLCLEASNIYGGNAQIALPTACAIEMLHAQSLIHDDLPCMDNDDLRRGKPSNHKVFGEAIAVLAGDALISFGAQTIIDKTPDTVSACAILKVLKEYNEAAGVFGIVGGQTADIEAENKKVSLEHLNIIHKYKTSALFKFSLVAGSILAQADEAQIQTMKNFGDLFGLAFQIKDDILDVTSTTSDLGKTIGKDNDSNKSTYVTMMGLNKAEEKLNEIIEECYGILRKEKIASDVFKEIIKSLENKNIKVG